MPAHSVYIPSTTWQTSSCSIGKSGGALVASNTPAEHHDRITAARGRPFGYNLDDGLARCPMSWIRLGFVV